MLLRIQVSVLERFPEFCYFSSLFSQRQCFENITRLSESQSALVRYGSKSWKFIQDKIYSFSHTLLELLSLILNQLLKNGYFSLNMHWSNIAELILAKYFLDSLTYKPCPLADNKRAPFYLYPYLPCRTHFPGLACRVDFTDILITDIGLSELDMGRSRLRLHEAGFFRVKASASASAS